MKTVLSICVGVAFVIAVGTIVAGCSKEEAKAPETTGDETTGDETTGGEKTGDETTGGDAPAVATAQTTCPIMGKKIDKDTYIDHAGKRVYFCCPGCEAKFEKDPEKYLAKLKDQGVTLEDAPKGSGMGEMGHEGHDD